MRRIGIALIRTCSGSARSLHIDCGGEAAFEARGVKGHCDNSKYRRRIGVRWPLVPRLRLVLGLFQPTHGLRSDRARSSHRYSPMADASRSTPDGASDEIADLTTRVLAAWRKRLRRRKDAQPRTSDRGECERLLVAALLRVTESDDQCLPALAAAAARYGTEQPRARLDPVGFCDEFVALRQIVLKQLTMRGSPNPDVASTRIRRLDQALSIVTKAAVVTEFERGHIPPS